jgi:CubicO group peptidase (beta-lactamase class C family)
LGMKKNIAIKYLLVLLFFVLHSFSVATSVPEKDFLEKATELRKNVNIPLAYYPSELTREVNHKLDSTFQRFNKRHDFHGSVLVAKGGKVVFKEHYGYANFKEKTKIDDNSLFQLASVSKQFTAAAILILKDRNELSLDDKVTRFFPEFPYSEVTVRHLLNHTSGLPKYFWLAEHKWDKEYAPSNAEMMDMLSKEKLNPFFRPGANFDYSNTGYFVLSAIVEKVSGQSFADFMDREIFKPLNMRQSFVYSFGQDSIRDGQLSGYRLYRRRWHAAIPGTVNDAVVGDKNIYSTTEDLLKWVEGLNSGRLISEESLQEMYTKGSTKYNRKVPYGFGFRIKEDGDQKVIYHNGRWNGFSTSLMQYPEEDLVVITLEHSSYNSMKYLNSRVKGLVEDNFELD